MSHFQPQSPLPIDIMATSTSCHDVASCCTGDAPTGEPHDHVVDQRADGAGEPCPTPLMWQEVRENYLRDSTPWEIVRGPHHLLGRTWGEGPPLYFLNNFASTAELFSLVIWLLREKFRCVVFDAVTPDRRAARRTHPTMSEFAADLFAVADRHGDEKFTLYGASFGAAIALQAALEQPQRIESLLLQHGFTRRRLSMPERLLAYLCFRSGQTLNALPQRRRFQAVNHQPWFPPFDHSRFQFLLDSSGTLPLRDLARRAMAVSSFDVASRLSEVSCPVLLLRTEGEGRIVAESQIALAQGLKHPRTEWMHSAGQHPCLTHPHRVAKLIQMFCQSESPAKS
jgi:pimeloyl-ACP methyl ester carboxylesterase